MKRRKRKEPDYAFIAIKVVDYSVRVDAGINLDLLGSPGYIENEEDPVHRYETNLEITGLCTDPEDRAGHRFDIDLVGTPERYHHAPKIKDLHERDKDGVLRYRKLRGREYPVYAPPPPVAYLHKIRGENRWTAWLRVTPQMVTDSLILLSGPKPVYVSIHEIRENRQRRIQSLTIQTTDPAED